jgi:DNA-binding transcriptional LysR family regulator
MSDYGELVSLPGALARIAREAPGLSIQAEPDGDLANRLARGSIDLAVTIAGDLAPSLRHKRIAREKYAVALRAGHPALDADKAKLSLRAYCELDHLVVTPRGLPGSHVDAALAAKGLSRHVALRIPSFVSAPFIVASSDLVTTLGAPLLRSAARFANLVLLPPPLTLPVTDIVMVWHERTHESPVHALFRRIVEASAAETIGT